MFFAADGGLLGGDAVEFGFAGEFFGEGQREGGGADGVEGTSAFDDRVVREPNRFAFLEIGCARASNESRPFIETNNDDRSNHGEERARDHGVEIQIGRAHV